MPVPDYLGWRAMIALPAHMWPQASLGSARDSDADIYHCFVVDLRARLLLKVQNTNIDEPFAPFLSSSHHPAQHQPPLRGRNIEHHSLTEF